MRSSKRCCNPTLAWLVSLCVLSGCAPTRLEEGVPYVTAKYKVADAKLRRVTGYPCLRVDDVALDRLDHAERIADLPDQRAQARRFVEESHAGSIRSTRNELDRLGDAGWRELSARYVGLDAVPGPEA